MTCPVCLESDYTVYTDLNTYGYRCDLIYSFIFNGLQYGMYILTVYYYYNHHHRHRKRLICNLQAPYGTRHLQLVRQQTC